MTKFNVLPTDPRFQSLTVEQLDYIISSMVQDNKEAENMARGVSPDNMNVDSSYDWEDELELPTAEEDAEMARQEKAMRDEKRRRIEHKRESGVPLTPEDLKTIEALDEYEKRMKEYHAMIKVMEETGMSYEDYKFYEATGEMPGGSLSPIIEEPQGEVGKDANPVLDDIVNSFEDDDDEFLDLT